MAYGDADEYPATNSEGRYYKIYVTTYENSGTGARKKGKAVGSTLNWFTAKGAADMAARNLIMDGYGVTKLYRT